MEQDGQPTEDEKEWYSHAEWVAGDHIKWDIKPVGHEVALSARLLQLPRDHWEGESEGPSGTIEAQLRVRCGMQDCPGDFGRISLVDDPNPDYAIRALFFFHPARGLTPSKTGVWAEGKRAQAARKRGRPALGRRPHERAQTWEAGRPLTRFEMFAPSEAFWPIKSATYVECPVCHRLTRMDGEKAAAALEDVRRNS